MANDKLKIVHSMETCMRGVMVLGVLLWSCNALAQPMRGMAPAFVPMSPAIQAYQDAMKKMMDAMNGPYTGDADRDFATHMIPHHQGATDMAQIELTYGTDPKMRKLAADVVAAQKREIAGMQAWLVAHPARVPHPANPRIQWK